ncbi:MAG: hypothetical protein IH937_14160 [Acidobacteria bacterium]|nr:hypothetical protein [Acidobacteriota bacterium]
MVHERSRVSLLLDISMIDVPPLCQFRFAQVSGKQEMEFESLELLGAERLAVSPDPVDIEIGCHLA